MSRLIYICARHGARLPVSHQDIERLSRHLAPDHVQPRSPRIIESAGVLIGIFDPVTALPMTGMSVCLGTLFDDNDHWWQPGTAAPDGSYALFRGDANYVELVSDMVASRTIWYVMTETLFIASTSQRAIIAVLGSFVPNKSVYPWMISSGTLGPGLSWDLRIQCVQGDARLLLDRASWSLHASRNPVSFEPAQFSNGQHEARLRHAIEETFARLSLDPGKWMLLLSGGYDSRLNMVMLKDRPGLSSMTWGRKSALEDRRSDAWIARELARRSGIGHEYFSLDSAAEPVAQILQRFLLAGEGRVDHISGYMDGFAVWRYLHDSGYDGVIRGDEAFGCHAVKRAEEVYQNMSLDTLEDYGNLAATAEILRDCAQQRPAPLEQRDGESLAAWRDRLNSEFELPSVLAALNDLKTAYVEVANPLLSRRIISCVRGLPDSLRTNKRAMKHVVNSCGLKLHYASSVAIQSKRDIVRLQEVVTVISQHLSVISERNGHIAELARHALALLQQPPSHKRDASNRLERLVSAGMYHLGIRPKKVELDPYLYAFRIYILARMTEILQSDAEALQRYDAAPRAAVV